MGSNVLSESHDGFPYLCAYAHCAKQGLGNRMMDSGDWYLHFMRPISSSP
ncbi:Heparanase-like protein 2 [Senna tora]|uniref:Heparanase-like protein 2 n=1 Tax=Senna tora TaxID=362788 RepID=A0A834XAF9_9FABA|nr:Heparanase-like protein 2 [Senna tora]